jgi:hypothetical protein
MSKASVKENANSDIESGTGFVMGAGLRLRWVIVGGLIGLGLYVCESVVRIASHSSIRSRTSAQRNEVVVPETECIGLRIECRNDDECMKTSESNWNDGQGPRRRKFLRVRIYNDGPTTAKNCTVTLASVTEITSNGTLATDFDGSSLLIWSSEGTTRTEGKSIRPNGNPEVADLFYTVLNPAGDEIYLKDERYSSFLRFGRRYNFEVIARAEGLQAVTKNIKVQFGPRWNDFEVVSN